MSARGMSPAPWRVSVRGFIAAADLARGPRLFFGWPWRLRLALLALTRLGLCALVAALAARLFGYAIDGLTLVALAAATVLCAAGWLAAVALRRKPARLLFVGAGADPAAAAMVRRELGAFGHVARMDAPDGPLLRSAADYRALARRMRRRLRLNLATAISSREALPLRAAPHWRLLALQLLSASCDALIVDLSDGAGALEDVRDEARAGRCVFVTLWGRIDSAEAALRAAGVDAPCFHYAPDGEMQRRGQFRAAVIEAMRATHRVSA